MTGHRMREWGGCARRLVCALGLAAVLGVAAAAPAVADGLAPDAAASVASASGDGLALDATPICLPRLAFAAGISQPPMAVDGDELAQSVVCCCPTSSGECCNYVRGPYCGPRVPGCPCGR